MIFYNVIHELENCLMNVYYMKHSVTTKFQRSLDCNVLYIYIYMVFTTEGLFEVAIESWPEWDLNPRPLNSVQIIDLFMQCVKKCSIQVKSIYMQYMDK